jgi:hypothetical protein
MSYVYGFRNVKTGMMNIGYYAGHSKLTYITSLKDEKFWEDYSKGLMEESILYYGFFEEDLAQTIEWFALKYGIATNPDKFYLKRNNAHCVDESLLTPEIKQIVVDYIEGHGNGIQASDPYADDKFLVSEISNNLKEKKYHIHELDVDEVYGYMRNQVRVQQFDSAHVNEICINMRENPAKAQEVFGPVIVVVKSDGTNWVLDGNSRLEAAKRTKGWGTVPVVFLNESQFGADEKTRENNYDLFGLLENKKAFEVKKPNSKEDLKRNINNFIVGEGLNLADQQHVQRARQIIYDRFLSVCESKHQLNGILNSILSDFEKNQAELKYQDNIRVYSEAFLSRHLFEKYQRYDIATVCTSQTTAKHAEVLGWILRRMKNIKKDKGAIVLYYKDKKELVNEEEERWIDDLKNTIEYCKLPITVEVLDAFYKNEKSELPITAEV